MDVFNPNNDQIEKYLRGELHGAELEQFLRSIETDPELKKEIAFKQLLVHGIQQHGSIQLKNYIKQRVSHKKGMRITYQTWYFAAAAVGLLLIGSVVVFMQSNKQTPSNSTAKNEIPLKIDSSISANSEPNRTASTQGTESKVPAFVSPELDESYLNDGERDMTEMGPDWDGGPHLVDPDPTPIVIASNVAIVPIKISAGTKETVTMSQPASAENIKTKSGGITYSKDSLVAKTASTSTKEISRFKITFYEIAGTKTGISVDVPNKSIAEANINTYNLPYLNPLIVVYQNQYYLKTGEEYYVFSINRTDLQTPVKVTDQSLLKLLNQ